MSDTDESNTKTVDDAVILSEVEHAENSLNVNKTSDNKCDPLFKDTCTDNESDSVNEKKRHISDNENSDEETLHPNKKYKSCANAEQSAELQEVNKESDVLSSATSSNVIDVTDDNKEVSDSLNVPIPLENTPNLKESLSEEKSNEQKSQGNDKAKISKFDSDTDAVVNDENLESNNENLESIYANVLKHIETTPVVVRCERMNFEKYLVKKPSNTETNSLSSENEETSKKVSGAKKIKKAKINHKISESSDSEGENVKDKKKLPKKQKMKIENSNVEFMDCDEAKNDVSVTLNKSNTKISEQEISDLINSDSNDEKLNKGDTSCESDNDSGINIAKINKKKLSKDSGIESESLQNEKKILDPESDNSNSSDNESKSRTKTKKLPKKSPGEKSMDSESHNSDNESRNKKILKKSTKINEKKANFKKLAKKTVQIESENDSDANSRKNGSDSEESDKEKKSSGSESEKDENSDKENYKSSSSESKSRTKKLSKKSTNNNSKDETDSDNEDDPDDKSDTEDQLTKEKNLDISKKIDNKSETDSKSKRNPERGIERLKKFLRIAGIHVNNFGKLFDNIKTIKGKERKLLGLLEDNGLEGRPTIKKCEEIRKKNDIAKEVAELDTSNIIAKDSRPKRGTPFRQRQRRSPTPDPNEYQRTFNRIRALVDSDSD
ncbi:cylicin-2-like [Chrysoperla carnea]|uniref:cylicin-2-like n=1 Tax=Chrysoperla carnea TaxID=189513 RepID=UPI001D082213|nr:cylicin-2-like [Chrysoperla carnea]